jgi:hypothetical protein
VYESNGSISSIYSSGLLSKLAVYSATQTLLFVLPQEQEQQSFALSHVLSSPAPALFFVSERLKALIPTT